MSAVNGIAKRRATASLEEAVGGREALTELLAVAERDTKQDVLLRLLSDPARARDTLDTICRDAGVSPTEVLALFRDAALAQGLVRAQTTLAERLDAVVVDVAEKAQNHREPCPDCGAFGAPDPGCETCGGRGEIYHRGELEHARMVFEATGLTKKGGGVNVSVKQQMGVAIGGGMLDKFVRATDQAAFDIFPGEVLEEDQAPSAEGGEPELPAGEEDPGAPPA